MSTLGGAKEKINRGESIVIHMVEVADLNSVFAMGWMSDCTAFVDGTWNSLRRKVGEAKHRYAARQCRTYTEGN